MIRSYDQIQQIIEPPINFEEVVIPEILTTIFGSLHFYDIEKTASLVNRRWCLLAKDPLLLKQVIYRDMTVSPEVLNAHFGKDFPGALDHDLAWKYLPDNIGKIFRSTCPLFPEEKLGGSHVIAWIPKDLSIYTLGDHLMQKFPENEYGYGFIYETIIRQHGDNLVTESKWVVMRRKVIRPRIDLHFDELKKIDSKGFESSNIPNLLEAALCILGIYFKTESKTKLFDDTLIICEERIAEYGFRWGTGVGFKENGLTMTSGILPLG